MKFIRRFVERVVYEDAQVEIDDQLVNSVNSYVNDVVVNRDEPIAITEQDIIDAINYTPTEKLETKVDADFFKTGNFHSTILRNVVNEFLNDVLWDAKFDEIDEDITDVTDNIIDEEGVVIE